MIELDVIEKRYTQLREVHRVQGQNGTWDYDEYMRGLHNGLELALAIMEGRDPNYKDPITKTL